MNVPAPHSRGNPLCAPIWELGGEFHRYCSKTAAFCPVILFDRVLFVGRESPQPSPIEMRGLSSVSPTHLMADAEAYGQVGVAGIQIGSSRHLGSVAADPYPALAEGNSPEYLAHGRPHGCRHPRCIRARFGRSGSSNTYAHHRRPHRCPAEDCPGNHRHDHSLTECIAVRRQIAASDRYDHGDARRPTVCRRPRRRASKWHR